MTAIKKQYDGAQLLDAVVDVINKYLVIPNRHGVFAVALWIAATHATKAWNTAPRLVIRAPEKRSGKSRLLDIIEALAFNPIMTINASPSAIYRSIGADDDPPTILLDEADAIFNMENTKNGGNEDLRGLLNAGHQRNRPALRYDASTRTVEKIDTYAMAALAGIGAMPDTIEDRAVIIRMKRLAPDQHVADYRYNRDRPPLDQLRKQLHKWARQNTKKLTTAIPETPLKDRAADTWEPLFAIADQANRHWPDLARQTALSLEQEKDKTEESPATRLLADCQKAFRNRDFLPTNELLNQLNANPEAPWSTFRNNQPLNAVGLGRILKQFDIKPTHGRTQKIQQRGYYQTAFQDAWHRYLGIPPETRNTRNTRNNPRSGLLISVTGQQSVTGQTRNNPTCLGCRTNHPPNQQCQPHTHQQTN